MPALRTRLALAAAAAGLTTLAPAAPVLAAPAPTVVKTCTEAALRSAVATVPQGGTVRFGCDGTIPVTPEGGGLIEVAPHRHLTIDGAGRRVKIDGAGETSLFSFGGSTQVTLRRLTLARGDSQNGQVPGGGAIWNFGTLTVDDVTFDGNRAFEYGGAILSVGSVSRLTVTRSRFTDNAVTCVLLSSGGGAIATFSPHPTVIDRSVFRGNATNGNGRGGAVLAMPRYYSSSRGGGGAYTITRSTFSGNRSEFNQIVDTANVPGGGAVATYDHPLTIRDSAFTDNLATGASGVAFGGAVLANGFRTPDADPSFPASPVVISGSTFTGNRAGAPGKDVDLGEGGALAVRNRSTPSTVTDTTFTANGAASAGALYTASPLALDRVTIAGNRATRTVGTAIAGGLLTFARTTMRRTTLRDNTPANCATHGSGTVVDEGGNTERPGVSCLGPGATPAIAGSGVSRIGTAYTLQVNRGPGGGISGHATFVNPGLTATPRREGDVTCVRLGSRRAVFGIVDTAGAEPVYREFYVEAESRGFRLTGLLNSAELPAPGAACRRSLPRPGRGGLIRSGTMTFAG